MHEFLCGLVVFEDHTTIEAGKLNSAGDDRRQHRLEIERGADGAPNFTQRRELIDRPRQVLGAGFEFLEESGVLDRDHGLVGKGLEERDLALVNPPGSRRPTPIVPIASS